jgi:hypothetical protein
LNKFAALLFLLAASLGFSQSPRPRLLSVTGSHYVQWQWTAPTTGTPAEAYNLYQASGACGTSGQTFVKLMVGNPLTNWQQTPLPAPVTCSYVTAVSAVGVEGLPSESFQLDITAPGAPGKPTPTYQ